MLMMLNIEFGNMNKVSLFGSAVILNYFMNIIQHNFYKAHHLLHAFPVRRLLYSRSMTFFPCFLSLKWCLCHVTELIITNFLIY